jgi:hypothetical protein
MIRIPVAEVIKRFGHDEDYDPLPGEDFVPTGHPPGSFEKIEVLRERATIGQPLWHDGDCTDYRMIKTARTPFNGSGRRPRSDTYMPKQTALQVGRKSIED